MFFFNRPDKSVEAPKVVIDDYRWAFFAVEHLINVRRRLGQSRPRVMHFKGPENIDPGAQDRTVVLDARLNIRGSSDPDMLDKD